MEPKIKKLYIYCGLIGMVLIFVGLIVARLLPPPSPNESASQLAMFYGHHRNAIRWGSIISMFGGAFLGPWVAMYTNRFREIEGPNSPSAYLQLALGALLIIEIVFPLMILEVAVLRSGRSPAEIQTLSDLCWIPIVGLDYTLIVELLMSIITIFSDKHERPIFPRWSAYFNVLMLALSTTSCFCVLTKTGPFSWSGAITFWMPASAFALWILVMSILMLQSIDREEAATPGPTTSRHEIEQLSVEVSALRDELRSARS